MKHTGEGLLFLTSEYFYAISLDNMMHVRDTTTNAKWTLFRIEP